MTFLLSCVPYFVLPFENKFPIVIITKQSFFPALLHPGMSKSASVDALRTLNQPERDRNDQVLAGCKKSVYFLSVVFLTFDIRLSETEFVLINHVIAGCRF